ncbi:hypothetical protein TCAL_11491 [Tigriopus californicus]|uniref:Uncharacterized protein n=1 Tax=Tigriopus californicus TaxID=6832 RepID=A0A553P4I7_TIGCA|nr:hypothetical protein TCAL_11491 [Tigriopus californicus]|eukprot:TCALIF_11491-PA protein Name:"Protein of unknown function" AED:0.23 eAED:0.23 QI:0/-1/0/1/-1/1/1/0/408
MREKRDCYDLEMNKVLKIVYQNMSEGFEWTNPTDSDCSEFKLMPKYIPVGKNNSISLVVGQQPVTFYREIEIKSRDNPDPTMSIFVTIGFGGPKCYYIALNRESELFPIPMGERKCKSKQKKTDSHDSSGQPHFLDEIIEEPCAKQRMEPQESREEKVQQDSPTSLGNDDWIQELANGSSNMERNIGDCNNEPLNVVLKEFAGDPLEWKEFIWMFHLMIHKTKRSSEEKLCRLKLSLKGEPAILLKNMTGGHRMYCKALILLKNRYGDPSLLEASYMKKIQAMEKVDAGDPESLFRYANEIRSLLGGSALGGNAYENIALELEEKLPVNEKVRWRQLKREMAKINKACSTDTFVSWVEELAQDVEIMCVIPKADQNRPMHFTVTLSHLFALFVAMCSFILFYRLGSTN